MYIYTCINDTFQCTYFINFFIYSIKLHFEWYNGWNHKQLSKKWWLLLCETMRFLSNATLGWFVVMLTTDAWFRRTPQTNQLQLQCLFNTTRTCINICKEGTFLADDVSRTWTLIISFWATIILMAVRYLWFDVVSKNDNGTNDIKI